MIPLFTTDHSIGKSILKFKPTKPNGPDSVVDIAKKHGLEKVYLLENRMHGFLDYLRYSEKNDFDFVFGLRLQVTSDF
jgi:DNA polymerase III alpha subunit